MKRFLTRLIACCLLLAMLTGLAFAASAPYVDENGVLVVPEDYYTEDGILVPAGYYLPDGSYIPMEETPTEDPSTEEPSTEEPSTEEPSAEDPSVTDPDGDDTAEGTIIRVGLYYSSDALDGANLLNYVGSGYQFGYYDGNNRFVPLGYTDQTAITAVKTENVYYGTYGGYTSYHDELTNASVGVGCYHLQLGGTYGTYEEAYAAASRYSGGFVAYISGNYYARIGSYLNRDAAVTAQTDLAASGVATELKGTSAYGVSVVITGTSTIVFQYDDNGSGTGLGVMPVSADGSKPDTWFKGNHYYGGFRFERISGGNLTVVNMVDLEDYVNCVISREMSDSWNLEALKAQAVAARSYAVTLTKHKAHHFDICPTTCCQAYHGTSKTGENTLRAVQETAGQYAWYNGKVAQTFYYSSNGGASESSSVVWGSSQSNYPYLIGIADPYEETIADSISGYEWTQQYTGAQLASILKGKGYTSCTTIVSVKVAAYTDTGNPKTVTFTDTNGKNYTLNARTMVSAFGFRSYRYDLAGTTETVYTVNGDTTLDSLSGLYVIDGNGNLVLLDENVYLINGSGTVTQPDDGSSVTSDVFTFQGKGWGHNVGMSQYGALAMAKLGYTYDEILKFYFTGITVGLTCEDI